MELISNANNSTDLCTTIVKDLKAHIDKNNVPEHVAIIMDGNGRWAQQKGEMRTFGHASGVDAVRQALTGATEIGVKYLTLYAFSTENWNRPKEEVDALMNLLVQTLVKEIAQLNDNGVRLKAIGDIENLPESCQDALKEAIKATSTNDRVELILALSYSSRWEIEAAVKRIATEVDDKKLQVNEINQELISSYLSTQAFPDPELLIRTSGECRVSNFLLWQIAYSELHFTPVLWPDFTKEHLFQAVLDYQGRERRFGQVSEQIEQN